MLIDVKGRIYEEDVKGEFLPLMVMSGHLPDGSPPLLERITWGEALWKTSGVVFLPALQNSTALGCCYVRWQRENEETNSSRWLDQRSSIVNKLPKVEELSWTFATCQFISHPQCHATEHWVLLQFAWFTCTAGNGGGKVSICLSIKMWDLGKQRSAQSNSQNHSLCGITTKKTKRTAGRLIVINWPRNVKLWLCIAAKQELILGSR